MKSHFVVFWMWLLLWHQMMWMWSHMINFKTMMLIIYRWEVWGCKKLFTFFIFFLPFWKWKKKSILILSFTFPIGCAIHSFNLSPSIYCCKSISFVFTEWKKNSLFFDVMSHIDGYDENGKKKQQKEIEGKTETTQKAEHERWNFFFFFFNSFPFFIFPINTKIERTWLLRYWWFSIFCFFFFWWKKFFFFDIFCFFDRKDEEMRTSVRNKWERKVCRIMQKEKFCSSL